MYKFIAKYDKNWGLELDDITRVSIAKDETQVIIKRAMTFFYVEQKTTLSALRKQYTDKAIAALESDGFIYIRLW